MQLKASATSKTEIEQQTNSAQGFGAGKWNYTNATVDQTETDISKTCGSANDVDGKWSGLISLIKNNLETIKIWHQQIVHQYE